MKLWQVAVNAPLKTPLTYAQPKELDLSEGDSVFVPLGSRKASGIIISETTKSDSEFAIKQIQSLNPDRPRLSTVDLKWGSWLSQYYVFPIGMTLENFFPPLKKQGRKKLSDEEMPAPISTDLNPRQNEIFNDIKNTPHFATHLIHGVTGSGKTEIYIKLIEEQLKLGKQCIFLLPEISLTPQLVERFLARLGGIVAVIHSDLTEREKTNHWWAMYEKKKSVLIGARSALFCPIPDLGLIIIDEEHESSFKQDEKLRYHARDAAIVKAQMHNIPIVMGSATPSLESWSNAINNKFKLHSLSERHGGSTLPDVQIVDLEKSKSEKTNTSLPYWMSEELFEALNLNYEKKFQSALFLNRRGVAPLVQCLGCGFNYMCPNCDISLTLHGASYLVCHYCNFTQEKEHTCPDCKEFELQNVGIGTEQIEKDIQNMFPLSKTVRFDRDEITHRDDLVEKIKLIETNSVDFIIGTQMIAKGLDFPRLNLVGVVLADVSLNFPDFRSSERTFQLLTQVAGRSGRRQTKGNVIIQTYRPEHISIVQAAQQNFIDFAKQELVHREELNYPPFCHIAMIKVQSNSQQKASNIANTVRASFENWKSEFDIDVTVLGPAPARMARLKNKFRFQLLIKSKDRKALNKLIWKLSAVSPRQMPGVEITLDVDPQTLI